MFSSVRWFLTSIVCIFLGQYLVTSLSIESLPEYSVTEDALLHNLKLDDSHELPRVSKREYPGNEFYGQIVKTVPRVGRRSEPNFRTCSCIPEELSEFWQNEVLLEPANTDSIDDVKRARSYLGRGFP